MKLNKDFVMRQVADTWVVIPFGAATAKLNGMINLNETGALLWQALERGASEADLVETLLAEYKVTREQALSDVAAFLATLQQAGCLLSD